MDWIVMKCLEKDRTRRYKTASDLAEDLNRQMTHQPVLAVAPTITYRLQRFSARHAKNLAQIAAAEEVS